MNALNAYNKLNANVAGLKKASEKLSSGYRINRAGDDAAGLAISEKMRSQIRGLNQAKRNAQDGISMIQTFEGAAQETHTILQRMKELATESANGTYDNQTDRAAIQLEFDQLNDELNQLADTDFNGTIVLNGGVMSDGLEQVKGSFDYANKEQQVIDKAKASASAALTDAKKAWEDAKTTFEGTNYDLGQGPEFNDIDNNNYKKAEADAVWKALGIVDKDDNTKADTSEVTEVAITFKYDGSAWKADSAVDNNGYTHNTSIDTKITVEQGTETTPDTGATGEGGFAIKADATSTNVNVIFDSTNAKEGDTITVVFKNSDDANLAHKNIGMNADSVEVSGLTAGAKQENMSKADLKADVTALKDSDMTEAIEAKLNAFEDIEVKMKYDATAASNNKALISFAGGTEIDMETATTTGAGNGTEIKLGNGQSVYAYVTTKAEDDADGVVTIYDINDDTAGKGTALATFKVGMLQNADGNDKKGIISGKVSLSKHNYGSAGAIRADIGKSDTLGSSKENKAALDAAYAKFNEAQNVKITDYESAKAYLDSTGVSISDAFNNSTAIMTYTENIILQTGARSKDAVNFTFKYNKADMGDLKPTLNISAREDGLNTEGLSLATAEDANYAIDQIDKAINKTSMVRASFGAVQNRLDYKIENLTTTSENLTEAESNIRDTDMANEMLNYTKFNILQQAAQSMLAQANQQPQSILQLLG